MNTLGTGDRRLGSSRALIINCGFTLLQGIMTGNRQPDRTIILEFGTFGHILVTVSQPQHG
tara:strand:- start:2247 stop:2429 length:183 start_codon:yes stop_codon:yes gene_type:complete